MAETHKAVEDAQRKAADLTAEVRAVHACAGRRRRSRRLLLGWRSRHQACVVSVFACSHFPSSSSPFPPFHRLQVAEKDKALRALQSQSAASTAGDGDLKKQLQRAQEALKVRHRALLYPFPTVSVI